MQPSQVQCRFGYFSLWKLEFYHEFSTLEVLFSAARLLGYVVFLLIKKHRRYAGSKTRNILMNFKKKISKIRWVMVDFFENLENLEHIFENFPLKIVLKIENQNFQKFRNFRFPIRFSMEIFQKIFSRFFEIFKKFDIFWNHFFFGRHSMNFHLFFLKSIRMFLVFDPA